MQERRLVEVPVNVVNKPGGGGTIAQAYLQQHAGDAHYLEITATSLLTNHITGKSAVQPPGFHADRHAVRRVHRLPGAGGFAASRRGKDLLERVEDRRRTRSPIGIATAAGNTNHIAAALAAQAAGADVKKLKVVVFGSGGEAMTALLGGHVGLVVTPSANAHPAPAGGHACACSPSRRRSASRARSPPCRRGRSRAPTSSWRTGGRSSDRRDWPRRRSPTGKAAFAKLDADRRMEERDRARRRRQPLHGQPRARGLFRRAVRAVQGDPHRSRPGDR